MGYASAAGVLRILRDEGEQTLAAIAGSLDTPVWSKSSIFWGQTFVGPCVEQLAWAGLVTLWAIVSDTGARTPLAVVDLRTASPTDVVVVPTQTWSRVQEALGISLTELDRKAQGISMLVSPVFGPRRPPAREAAEVFVIMPFEQGLNAVFDVIRMVALTCNLSISRADDFFGSGVIVEQIWEAICASKLVIADCTHRNPNVFYELGLAHAVGKPVLILTQTLQDVPFDVRHRRAIHYETTESGIRQFMVALESGIRRVLAE
jgi:hypothetical protein